MSLIPVNCPIGRRWIHLPFSPDNHGTVDAFIDNWTFLSTSETNNLETIFRYRRTSPWQYPVEPLRYNDSIVNFDLASEWSVSFYVKYLYVDGWTFRIRTVIPTYYSIGDCVLILDIARPDMPTQAAIYNVVQHTTRTLYDAVLSDGLWHKVEWKWSLDIVEVLIDDVIISGLTITRVSANNPIRRIDLDIQSVSTNTYNFDVALRDFHIVSGTGQQCINKIPDLISVA